MSKLPSRFLALAVVLVASGGCMHYRESSWHGPEYDSAKGKFEDSDHASVGFTTEKAPPRPVSESELKKSGAK